MKLNIYGKKLIEVVRENDNWSLFLLSEGKKIRLNDFVVPAHYSESEVVVFIADILHEGATPENPDITVIE